MARKGGMREKGDGEKEREKGRDKKKEREERPSSGKRDVSEMENQCVYFPYQSSSIK